MGCAPTKAAARQAELSAAHKPEEGREADYWFEIPLDNANLFPNLRLRKLPNLLPGRLYSTRMPRNLTTDLLAKQAFDKKCKDKNLNVVLILTERFEYDEYAKADIEVFYTELGLECMVYPIRDFSCPSARDFAEIVRRMTLHLADGKNVLVHCAGGNGRTGMVLCGILKNCGVQNPIEHARRVKSTYVETPEQEKLIEQLPISVTEAIFIRHPTLAKIIAIDKLIAVSQLERRRRLSARREAGPFPITASVLKQQGRVIRQQREAMKQRYRKGWFRQVDNDPLKEDEVDMDVVSLVEDSSTEASDTDDLSEPQEESKTPEQWRKDRYTSTQLKGLRQTFRNLDHKGDRKLSFNELSATLNGIGEDSYAKKRQLRTVLQTFGKEEQEPDSRRQRWKPKNRRRKTIEFDDFATAMMSPGR